MGSDAQTVGAAEAPMAPEPQPMAPPPAAAGGGKGKMIAVAVVVIVVVAAVFGYMFLMGGGVEGKWVPDKVEIFDADGTLNQTMTDMANEDIGEDWIQFNKDGTVSSNLGMENATWTAKDGKLTITQDGDPIVYDYKVSGNKMTLEMSMGGMKTKVTLKRA